MRLIRGSRNAFGLKCVALFASFLVLTSCQIGVEDVVDISKFSGVQTVTAQTNKVAFGGEKLSDRIVFGGVEAVRRLSSTSNIVSWQEAGVRDSGLAQAVQSDAYSFTYKIYLHPNTQQPIAQTSDTFYIHDGINSSDVQRYVVQAVLTELNGTPLSQTEQETDGNTDVFEISTQQPGSVSTLSFAGAKSAFSIATDKITLLWDKASGGSGIVFYFIFLPANLTRPIAVTTNLFYTLTELNAGQSYSYVVRAQDDLGADANQVIVSATTFTEPADTLETTLVVSDGPQYNFENTNVGEISDHTFTVSIDRGTTGQITTIVPTLSGPFTFKGGSFPGTGGTCSSVVIESECTLVVTFSPSARETYSTDLSLAYFNGLSQRTVSRILVGVGLGPGILSISEGGVGNTTVSSSTDKSIIVNNTGDRTASLISSNTPSAPFAFKGGSFPGTGGTCSTSLETDSSCTLVITYTPSSAVTTSQTLTLTYSDSVSTQTASQTLTGTGITATLLLSGTFAFGEKTSGTTTSQTLTLSNTGSSAAQSISFSGLSAPFSKTGGSCTATLDAGQTCTVIVAYAPTTYGSFSDDLDISYSDGVNSKTQSQNLTGTVPVAVLSLSEIGFGNGVVGLAAEKTVIASNTGGSPATLVSAAVISSPFALKGGSYPGTGGTCGSTVNPSSPCTVILTYTPSTTGASTQTFSLTYSDGAQSQTASGSMTGTGITATLTIVPEGESAGSYAFGQKVSGTATSKTFTVSNTGSATAQSITVTGLASPYAQTGGSCASSLTGGSTCTVIVEYGPTSTGSFNDSIEIAYTDSVTAKDVSQALTGSAVSTATLGYSPSPHDFDARVLGISKSQTVTVTNSGGSSATSISDSGLAPPFGFKDGQYPGTGGTCGSSLSASGTCTLVLVFTPLQTGDGADTLTLTYNNGLTTTTVDLSLTGSGTDSGNGTWSAIATASQPSIRLGSTLVWTGRELIVWGGYDGIALSSGGKFDPVANSWSATASSGLNTRYKHTAIWNGREMIVWGGIDGGNSALDMGGRYNPAANTWIDMTLVNAPDARYSHTAVWTGQEMIIWGGTTGGSQLNTGARYNPGNIKNGDSEGWTAMTTTNAPSARENHTATWNGNEMIVWGGDSSGVVNSGARYNPGNIKNGDSEGWTAMTTTNAPSARENHTATWNGNEMIIWGGTEGSTVVNSGARYDPGTIINGGSEGWTTMTTVNALSPREKHTAVWTGTEIIIWGGTDGVSRLSTGGLYDPGTIQAGDSETWTLMTGSSAPAARDSHIATWTGDRMLLWGGDSGSAYLNTGASFVPRSLPSNDTWTAMTTTDAPLARWFPAMIWTGKEAIVWGGRISVSSQTYTNTGGKYDPVTDTWISTTTTNAPSARSAANYPANAIWTGRELIVWGGHLSTTVYNTGGRYDPVANSWSATSTTSAPTARISNTTLWTGKEMIIWGGYNASTTYYNTGGLYDPVADTWTTITTTNAPSARRSVHPTWTGKEMVVWGGSDASSKFNTGAKYDPVADTWATLSTTNAPSARTDASVVWTGKEMIIWGGINSPNTFDDGSRYDPVADTWTTMTTTNAPGDRWVSTSIWTGRHMIVWGGHDIDTNYYNGGGLYDPVADTWTTMTTTTPPQSRKVFAGVWTGIEMIIWGGHGDTSEVLNTGARYRPPY